MTALNGRPVEVEFDYNSDGTAYFSGGNYADGAKENLNSAELSELHEAYPEILDEAAFVRSIVSWNCAYEEGY